MSFAATFNAFQISGISKAEQHVLTAICTFADKNGVCWPTVETIASRCLSSVRTVQVHISALVAKGLIERIHRKGRPATTKVLVPQTLTPATSAPLPPQNLHPEPVIESVNTKTAAAVAPSFETATAATVVSEKIPELPVIPDVEIDFGPLEPLQRVDATKPLPQVAQAPVEPSTASIPEPMAQEPVAEPGKVAIDPPVDAQAPVTADPLAEVPATLLQDLGEVRKAKKKPAKVTRTEAQILAQEAAKAGLSVADVVFLMVTRGWSRFEASWIQHVPPQAVVQGPQSVFVPEVVKPASPSAIAKFKEAWAKQRAEMVAGAAQRNMDRLRC